jgi:hypothetical protein
MSLLDDDITINDVSIIKSITKQWYKNIRNININEDQVKFVQCLDSILYLNEEHIDFKYSDWQWYLAWDSLFNEAIWVKYTEITGVGYTSRNYEYKDRRIITLKQLINEFA